MGDTRDVYMEPRDRAVIRTADVYQTEIDEGVAGYSDTLLTVVANFRNSGVPEGCNAQSMVGKSKRGEVALRLFAVVDDCESGDAGGAVSGGGPGGGLADDALDRARIVRAGFKTRGCLAMTACASAMCSMVEGKTLREALAITPDEVKDALDGVPWDKAHTPVFAVEGVRALAGDWLVRGGASLAELDELLPCDEGSVACLVCEHCSLRDTRVDVRVSEALRREREAREAAEAQAEARAAAERTALAAVFDDVRAQSSAGRLVEPSRWEGLGLVPAHMTAEAFEMLVYEYWEREGARREADGDDGFEGAGGTTGDEGGANAERGADAAGRAGRASRAGRVEEGVRTGGDDAGAAGCARRAPSSHRTASVAVGVPLLLRSREEPGSDAEGDAPGKAGKDARAGGEPDASGETSDASDAPGGSDIAPEAVPGGSAANDDRVPPGFEGLRVPEGFQLMEAEGEWTLVPLADGGAPAVRPIECSQVVALTGARGYYLYDRSVMTDAFAHWAFLAAEDDPLVAFAECVREESRVYPRPLSAASLRNDPFRMTADQVERAWEAARSSDGYDDIRRTVASNGDAYYYSSDYLSDARAAALAEWNAVGRYRNV